MGNNGIDTSVLFPQPIRPTPKDGGSPKPSSAGESSRFAEILEEKKRGVSLSFSKHAEARLQARGITLSAEDVTRLGGIVDAIARKGGRESLVMMGDSAFIVSVANRTVVTAIDRDGMKGSVFTNIDSAAIV